MKRRNLPFNALRAFEAAARHSSVSAAASELSVTPSTPSFASKWLVPRPGDWYANDGAARIHLQPSLNFLDWQTQKVDFAIRCGNPPWTGLDHEFFMPIHLVPVCNADYAKNQPPLEKPLDVLMHNLIHSDEGEHSLGEEWCDWMRGCGIDCSDKMQGISFHDPALAMQAAAGGLGLAMGYVELIGTDLQTGKLVTAFENTVQHQYSYYLVYDKTNNKDRKIVEFQRWLLNQR